MPMTKADIVKALDDTKVDYGLAIQFSAVGVRHPLQHGYVKLPLDGKIQRWRRMTPDGKVFTQGQVVSMCLKALADNREVFMEPIGYIGEKDG